MRFEYPIFSSDDFPRIFITADRNRHLRNSRREEEESFSEYWLRYLESAQDTDSGPIDRDPMDCCDAFNYMNSREQ